MKPDGETRPAEQMGIRPKRQAFILTLWIQGNPSTWRGSLEGLNAERSYFTSLEQLQALLHDHGWPIAMPTSHNASKTP